MEKGGTDMTTLLVAAATIIIGFLAFIFYAGMTVYEDFDLGR